MGFVKNHLGPALEKNGLSTKIWILDHNYNLWGRAVAELDDPDVRKYCKDVAFHGYVGTPEQMSKFHAAYPDVSVYWTEGGPDYTAPDYATDWANWGLVTIHSQTKEITKSGQYWAFAHFSRNVRRGAKRFESTGDVKGVEHVAFENPDGQRVLVVSNSGEAKTVTLKQATKVVELPVASNSVTTIVWS